MLNIQPQSVSDIVFSIKRTLESEYTDNTVVGEISNLSLSSAGHYYFNLSDNQASVSCALFKMDALRNPAIRKIKNGEKVLVRGPISLYARRGNFQIICKRVLPYGAGNLMAQYEMLKEKLRGEGLFDADQKIELPKFIKKIVIITALRGAALQDFLNIVKRRGHWFHVVIIPSVMQGNDCAPSVIRAIEKAEKLTDVDAIVITRGGGSMEDLWGFNDENLVRKVAELDIPVISAIGHQVDYTLLDFVADIRLETPSAAAEIVTQYQIDLHNRLTYSLKDLNSIFLQFKNRVFRRIDKVNPLKFLHLLKADIHKKEVQLERVKFFERGDILRIMENSQYLDEKAKSMDQYFKNLLERHDSRLTALNKNLSNLNPHNVLGRGYSFLQADDGKVVSSSEDFDKIKTNEELLTHFVDGVRKVKKA